MKTTNTINTNTSNNTYNQDLELEILTKKFISGEIKLDEYRKKVNNIELDARLDLRRVASKLKPILSPIRSPKQF